MDRSIPNFPTLQKWVRAVGSLAIVLVLEVAGQTPAHATGTSVGCSFNVAAVASDNQSPLALASGDLLSADTQGDSSSSTNPISCGGFGGSATISGTSIYGSGDQIAQFNQNATAAASGSVSPGHIGLSVNGTASSTPAAFFFLDSNGDPFAINNDERAATEGNISGAYTDTFTLNGAAGVAVTLQFTASFDGSFSSASTGQDNLNVFGSSGSGHASLNAPGQQIFDVTGMTGTTLLVVDAASLTANACAGGPICGPIYTGTDTESANASHTASLIVTDLTPGTSFTTASGFNYAAAPSTVPEPGSLLCLLTGMGVFFARRRKIDEPSSQIGRGARTPTS